ncbi:peptide ABC transporter permease [Hyphomicrobium nitrativorans NL23]|uniref:Peptide ABC transporter permease n=1 Tax=Hyphomicrobium nitrativorans NL23 TaxID=1029756 RepID=V5SGC5_9HYPH|nr:hypothetical protein [Hyphomicrobium nitrativorans]AHB49095.1 peptide ABC transporter permease [Hyphomicrobium nitrativorans NL23]
MSGKHKKRPDPYPAGKARQGEIVLRRPWQRAVFVAGLAGGVIAALVAWVFGIW